MGEHLRDLDRALGARVQQRIALAGALLRAPDWELRSDAVTMTSNLTQAWRGDYRDLVARVGEQLGHPEPRVCIEAATLLSELDNLAAPAAEALATCLASLPRESRASRDGDTRLAWITLRPASLPTIGPILKALAGLGDSRALPALRWALERKETPQDVGDAIASLGMAGAELVPIVCRRLRELPAVDRHDERRGGLVAALANLGTTAAPAVPDLLALWGDARLRPGIIHALGKCGKTARAAAPVLRGLLHGADATTAVSVASALWQIDGDANEVLPVFTRHIAGDSLYVTSDAARGVAQLGRAGAPAAPALRRLLDHPSPWVRTDSAAALWRTIGDAEATLPALCRAWEENALVRPGAARAFAEMGRLAAPAAPLLRREIAAPRRHNCDAYRSSSLRDDEALLRTCAEALALVDAG
jgi:hypothetical protein